MSSRPPSAFDAAFDCDLDDPEEGCDAERLLNDVVDARNPQACGFSLAVERRSLRPPWLVLLSTGVGFVILVVVAFYGRHAPRASARSAGVVLLDSAGDVCVAPDKNVCMELGEIDADCCAMLGEGTCKDGWVFTVGPSCHKNGAVTTCCHPEKAQRPQALPSSQCASSEDGKCLENGRPDDDCCALPGQGSCARGYTFSPGEVCYLEFGAVTTCCEATTLATTSTQTAVTSTLTTKTRTSTFTSTSSSKTQTTRSSTSTFTSHTSTITSTTTSIADTLTYTPVTTVTDTVTSTPVTTVTGTVTSTRETTVTDTATSTPVTTVTDTLTSTMVTTATVTGTTTTVATATEIKDTKARVVSTSTTIMSEGLIAAMLTVHADCAGLRDNCYASKCCKEAGTQCYLKTRDIAECRSMCRPGFVDFQDETRMPWSCEVLGVRTPSSPGIGTGSWPGQNCAVSRRCNLPGHECFAKNSSFGSCKKFCDADRGDAGWSCIRLGGYVPAPSAQPLMEAPSETSLYCFAVVGASLVPLSQDQQKNRLGIFDCDASDTFQAETGWSVKDSWHLLQKKGMYANYDWTVKADLDAVFFPGRLREHLSTLLAPAHSAMYLSDSGGSLSLFLSVLSTFAVEAYVGGYRRCAEHLDHRTKADSTFFQACLDASGVSHMKDSSLVRANANDHGDCIDWRHVAFTGLSKVDAWNECWRESQASDEGRIAAEARAVVAQSRKHELASSRVA